MKTSIQQLLLTSLISTFCVQGYVSADVPHTFEPGTPALASEVNENFSDLDSRLADLEALTSNSNFTKFNLPFSLDGDPQNVIVLKGYDESSGENIYTVRSRYQNSTETVSIQGNPTVRPYIANYVTVATGSAGEILSVYNYIESPDTENYLHYNIEQSVYDPDGTNKQIIDDSSAGSDACVGGTSRICMGSTMSSIPENNYNWHTSYNRAVINSYVMDSNNWSFDQVSIEVRNTGRSRIRIRAKGIGLIFQRYEDGGADTSAIYYRVNGDTRGSLAGTPFADDQPLDGLFF